MRALPAKRQYPHHNNSPFLWISLFFLFGKHNHSLRVGMKSKERERREAKNANGVKPFVTLLYLEKERVAVDVPTQQHSQLISF